MPSFLLLNSFCDQQIVFVILIIILKLIIIKITRLVLFVQFTQ